MRVIGLSKAIDLWVVALVEPCSGTAFSQEIRSQSYRNSQDS
jgi:hypothetical protein